MELSLAEDRSPLSAERSFMSVVRFVQDRHRYSGEQLANVLTAEGILCYADEGNKVKNLRAGCTLSDDGQIDGITCLA